MDNNYPIKLPHLSYSSTFTCYVNLEIDPILNRSGRVVVKDTLIDLTGFDLGVDNDMNYGVYDNLINVPVYVGFSISRDGSGRPTLEVKDVCVLEKLYGKTQNIKNYLSERELSKIEEAAWKKFEGDRFYGDES